MATETLKNKAGTLCLQFNPQLGGAITAYYALEGGRRIDLMRPAPESGDVTVLDVSSFPLTPFSNRIAQGRFGMNGTIYPVGPNFRDEPHPNHGDGWTSEWTLESKKDNSATLSLESGPKPGTPYIYRAQQTFTLGDDYLDIDMTIENKGKETLPFGLGHHPYFNKDDDTVLQANLTHVWDSEMMIPTTLRAVPTEWDFSKGRRLSDQVGAPVNGFGGNDYIDGCFQGWDRKAEVRWPSKNAAVKISADEIYSHFVIYVPQNNFICAEPVSHATDAFNLADRGEKNVGFRTLAPGETMGGKMRFAYAKLTTN